MGAWGNGNLENDGAQDVLADVCERNLISDKMNENRESVSEVNEEEINRVNAEVLSIFTGRCSESVDKPWWKFWS